MKINNFINEAKKIKPLFDMGDADRARSYIFNMLWDQGYIPYVARIKNFRVIPVDHDKAEAPAYVNKDGFIFVDKSYLDYKHDELLSALIRHEMLHIILRHFPRAYYRAAVELKNKHPEYTDLDPNNIASKYLNEVIEIAFRPASFYGALYGSPSALNIAGDLDLSQWYSPNDIAYMVDLGGLLIGEYKELRNLSFEEIADYIEAEDKKLAHRYFPKRYYAGDSEGNISRDSAGNLILIGEEPGDFEKGELNKEDILYCTLPNKEDIRRLSAGVNRVINHEDPEISKTQFPISLTGWMLSDNDVPEDKASIFAIHSDTILSASTKMYNAQYSFESTNFNKEELYPFLAIKNATLYKLSLFGEMIKYLGEDYMNLGRVKGNINLLVKVQPITRCSFIKQIDQDNIYEGSLVQGYLEKWAKENNFEVEIDEI